MPERRFLAARASALPQSPHPRGGFRKNAPNAAAAPEPVPELGSPVEDFLNPPQEGDGIGGICRGNLPGDVCVLVIAAEVAREPGVQVVAGLVQALDHHAFAVALVLVRDGVEGRHRGGVPNV